MELYIWGEKFRNFMELFNVSYGTEQLWTRYCTKGSTDSTVGQKWNCKLSRNNVACFKYDFVLFLLYAVTMLDLSMKSAGHDDVVSINRSINFVIDYFINRLIDFN